MAPCKASIDTRSGRVEGEYDSRFAGVVDAFVENFERRGEVGASCAVFLEDRPVVDVWGGLKAPGGDAWSSDTISMVWSNTKGASAIAAHLAAEKGLLDLDAPVSRYWPEFAQNGKEGATVAMMLDHSVGVPCIRDKLKAGAFCDFDYMADLLARQAPFWEPGSRHGYHGFTFAWTVGGLLRRATGKTLGTFFRDEVAQPLGADFWIGLPESEEHRVAPMIMPTEALFGGRSRANRAMEREPDAPVTIMMTNDGGFDPNSRACRAAEVGSANGMSNGRGLARLYDPLANGRFLARDTIARMGRVASASHLDATLLMPTRFSLGFMKTVDNRGADDLVDCTLLMSEDAFGHVGFGGSLGFADPVARMSFGYTMNRMGVGVMIGERGQSLVDAAYRAIGYRSNVSGAWTPS